MFVIGAMRVLLRVCIDYIICPHRVLPNQPRIPNKVGYKSKRHRSCPTRRERRGRDWPFDKPRKSALLSWSVRLWSHGDLLSIVVRGLLFISIASGLQLLRMCCGYLLAVISILVCGAPAGIARVAIVGSSSIAWVAWVGGFASCIATCVACRAAGVAVKSTMFWAVVDAFLLMNNVGLLIRLMIVWKRCECTKGNLSPLSYCIRFFDLICYFF